MPDRNGFGVESKVGRSDLAETTQPQVNRFDFLSVLVSIIIALGISHILASAARLIRRRGKVRLYLPTTVWMVTLLLLQVQVWWVAFYRRDIVHWTFFGFLLYLLIPILISLLGYLLVPEFELEVADDVDLEREYGHNRRWFFGFLGAVVIVSLLEDVLRSGRMDLDLNSCIRLLFLGLSAAGFAIGNRRAQLPVALVFLGTLVCYIGFVFRTL